MKVVKVIALGVLGLFALFGLFSFTLSSSYKVERSIDINAPMETVYPLVYDPKAWARWSVWNRRDPGMAVTYSGAPAGVGAKWSWQSKSEGSGSMEFTGAEFNKSVVYKVSFAAFDAAMSGRMAFSPTAKGVRVTWIAEGDVGSNPLMRYFAMAMEGIQGPDFDGGLANLKQLAEKSP
jgi:uncharacterized protein YndB with AHSA1/START domain